MTNQAIDIAHAKLRGEWAELRFMSRAAETPLVAITPSRTSSTGSFARRAIKSNSAAGEVHHSRRPRGRIVQLRAPRCNLPRRWSAINVELPPAHWGLSARMVETRIATAVATRALSVAAGR